MKRLIPLLLAAVVATFPPSLLIVLFGGLASVGVSGAGGSRTVAAAAGGIAAMASTTSTSNSMVSHASLVASMAAGSKGALTAVVSAALAGGGVMASPDATLTTTMTFRAESLKVTVEEGSNDGIGANGALDPSSCTHAFSQVEFTNTHLTEDIVIHSVHIQPSLVATQGPQQLPSDYSSDRVLRLDPGSAATVPVSIFPHWRTPRSTNVLDRSWQHSPPLPRSSRQVWSGHASSIPQGTLVANSNSAADMPGNLSLSGGISISSGSESAIQKDFVDLMGISQGCSCASASTQYQQQQPNSGQPRIHETLIAVTSRGIIEMQLQYSCVPSTSEYAFGLPSNLMFIDGGIGWHARGSVINEANNTDTVANSNTMPSGLKAPMSKIKKPLTLGGRYCNAQTISTPEPYFYNVFMNNPSSEDDIHIWQVFSTKPNLVSVEIHSSLNQHNIQSSYSSTYYPLLGVPSIIPRDTNHFYLATLRLLPDNFNGSMVSSSHDMGFLEIRTSVHSFAIALDFIPKSWGNSNATADHQNCNSNLTSIAENNSAIYQKHVTPPDIKYEPTKLNVIKTYRALDRPTDDDTQQPEQQGKETLLWKDFEAPTFVTAPSIIDFGVITTGSRMVRVPINITNKLPVPIRIMRISVSMKTVLEEGYNSTNSMNEFHRFDVGVDFSGSRMMQVTTTGRDKEAGKDTYEYSHDMIIPAMSTSMYPLNVWCKFNSIHVNRVSPRMYVGGIVIRVSPDVNMTFRDWTEQLLSDDGKLGRPFVMEIPFKASILPGNFGVSTESLLFPARFSQLSKEERSKIKQRIGGKNPEYFDRDLDITNNFPVPISITRMQINNSGTDNGFCRRHFSTTLFDRRKNGDWPTAEKEESWEGISVRVIFQNDENIGPLPRKCILTLETDRVGRQSLPLIVYGGELIVEMELPDGGLLNKDCLTSSSDGILRTATGLPCMRKWMEHSAEGKALSEAMLDMQQSKRRKKTWSRSCSLKSSHPLEGYFQSLLSDFGDPHAMHPAIMPFGAISAGNVATRSIYMTNLNHVPVVVSATSMSIGDMDIKVGIIPVSLLDGLQQLNNLDEKDGGLQYFLATSPLAQEFFSRLQYKVDITLSPRANANELKSLYSRQAMVHTFRNSSEFFDAEQSKATEEEMECTSGFVLSTDGTYRRDLETRKASASQWTIPPGGVARFTISVGAPSSSMLKHDVTYFVATGLVLQTNLGQALPFVLTYSALVGQLQLLPSSEVTDDTELVDKRGKKDRQRLSKQPSSPLMIEVPMSIQDFPQYQPSSYNRKKHSHHEVSADASTIFSHIGSGVSLSIESTFSQDIFLSEVQSCNEWFHFHLNQSNMSGQVSQHSPDSQSLRSNEISKLLTIKGKNQSRSASRYSTVAHIGEVHSTISCSHSTNVKSFFVCALEWLEKREQIQPPGCGLSEGEIALSSASQESLESKIESIKTQAIAALRDVVSYLSTRYDVDLSESKDNLGLVTKSASDSTGEPTNIDNGVSKYVSHSIIEMFQTARTLWNEIASLGLNIITGHVTAKTVYISPESFSNKNLDDDDIDDTDAGKRNGHHSPLTIPVSSVLLRSALDVPRLFNGKQEDSVNVLNFDTTHVAQTSKLYVPIVNPTGSPIRAKLAASYGSDITDAGAAKDVFVQSKSSDSHPWWTGGSYWMPDSEGRLISASHNVTIKSGGGAYVSLVNPALHAITAFVLGCGKRCGLRNDSPDSNSPEKLYGPIGAASGKDSTLLGRPHEAGIQEKRSPQEILGLNDPPAFSLGFTSTVEVLIPPRGTSEIGPIYFRPPTRGDFDSSIYIENSLTGFEEVKIRGRGGWEKIAFVDDEQALKEGGDLEFRYGRSALVFPGGASSSEASPVVKAVVVANLGDFPVEISSVYMASSEIMHFTSRRPHPSSYFRSDSFLGLFPFGNSNEASIKRCYARRFNLQSCDDDEPNVWLETLFSWFDVVINYCLQALSLSDLPQPIPRDTTRAKSLKDGFLLLPNENKTLFIEHRPDCTFQTSYASLVLEIENRNDTMISRRSIDSWQRTFRNKKMELLVGYDMSAYEVSRCIPWSPPKTSVWEETFVLPSFIRDITSFGLSRLTDANGNPFFPQRPIELSYLSATFLLLLLVLAVDLLFAIDFPTSRGSECSSWKPTCRCLARADPASLDLVALGREQTKHVLLSRFKKDGVLPTHCLLSDGSFTRERIGLSANGAQSKVGGDSNANVTPNRRTSQVNQQVMTLSDAVFHQHNLVNNVDISEQIVVNSGTGLLPCGLGWRTAMRRGIALNQSTGSDVSCSSPERKFFARTYDLRLKKKMPKKEHKTPKPTHAAPISSVSPVSSVTPSPAIVQSSTSNGHPPTVEMDSVSYIPLPQAKKAEHKTVLKANVPAAQRNASSVNTNGKNNQTTTKITPPATKSSPARSLKSAQTTAKIKIPAINNNNVKNALTVRNAAKEGDKAKFSEKHTLSVDSSQIRSEQKARGLDGRAKQQKQRHETKQTRRERANRLENKRDVSKTEKLDDSIGKSIKAKPNQRTLHQKSATESTATKTDVNGKRNGKEPHKHSSAAGASAEASIALAKLPRQSKKGNNGAKSSEPPKGKQWKQSRQKIKQETTPTQVASKNPPKSPESTASSTTTQSSRALSISQLDLVQLSFNSGDKTEVGYPSLASVPPSPRDKRRHFAPSPFLQAPATPTTAQKLRPPPGLPPPPGFTTASASLERTDSPAPQAGPVTAVISSPMNSPSIKPVLESLPGMDPSESSLFQLQHEQDKSSPPLDDLLSFIRGNDQKLDSALFPASLQDSSLGFLSNQDADASRQNSGLGLPSLAAPSLDPPCVNENTSEEAPDVQTLLGTDSGFNVMNFLDGILSEPAAQEPNNDDEAQETASPNETRTPFQAKYIGVPLDPWKRSADAPSSNDTLATIIGRIADVEATGLQRQDDQETLIAGIPLNSNAPPLLTPSAFQTAAAYAEPTYASLINDIEDESEDFLEPDSFYNQLLGED